jgi:hypothetical protein
MEDDGRAWSCTGSRGRTSFLMDDAGVTVRNGKRSRQFGWEEILWLRDASVGVGPFWRRRAWALTIVPRDGAAVTARATTNGTAAASPETLAAITRFARGHEVTAVLTGQAVRRVPWTEFSYFGAGVYPDPSGALGLREWTGTGWSPFLRVDPAECGPDRGEGPSRIWSPLTWEEQGRQRDAAIDSFFGEAFGAVWFGLMGIVLFGAVVTMPGSCHDVGDWLIYALLVALDVALLAFPCFVWRHRSARRAISAAKAAAALDLAQDAVQD